MNRQENREITRRKLLASARQVFARSGFDGASIDALAEAAGFTKGAFYSNFESKEAILLALLEEHWQAQAAACQSLVASGENLETLIDTLSEQSAELIAHSDWPLLELELQRQAGRNQVLAQQFGQLQSMQLENIAALVEHLLPGDGADLASRTADRDSSARVIARGILALNKGLAVQRAGGDKGLDADTLKALLARFYWAILSS